MGLEAGTYVQDLNQSNPVGATDPKAQGDDHLRLIKSVAKNTLPNASKPFRFPEGETITGNLVIDIDDENKLISANATGGAIAITLPVSAINAGHINYVQKTDASANAVTLTPASGNINGGASLVLSGQNEGVLVYWTGTTWQALQAFNGTFAGNIAFGGQVAVGGALLVTGNTTIGGTLGVTGDATFQTAIAEVNLYAKGLLQFEAQTLSDGATVNWPMATAPYAKLTAAGDRTIAAPTGEAEGNLSFFKFKQDGGGNRVPSWNAAYKGPGGAMELPDRGADEETLYLALTRGADDVIVKRLWGSGEKPISHFKEYDLGAVSALTVRSNTTQAHGLGAYPSHVELYLENTSTELGFSAGDRVSMPFGGNVDSGGGSNLNGVQLTVNTTNVILTIGDAPAVYKRTATIGTITQIDITKWKVILRVFA